MRRLLATAATACLLCFQSSAAPSPTTAVAVTAIPIELDTRDPAQNRVGRLRFLGGLQLQSSDSRFGGLSGMRFTAPGELVAVTDAGSWVTLTLDESGDWLQGIAAAAVRPIPGLDAQPMRGKRNTDAEALEVREDGQIWVAFERRHRVLRYPTMTERAREVTLPDAQWVSDLPANSGIEAMARMGSLWLFIAERSRGAGEPNALISRGGDPHLAYNRTIIAVPEGFNATDAHALDDTHVLVLSRHFTPLTGAAATIQLFPVDPEKLQFGPGETIATIAPPLTIDNMEAIAVRREGARTFIYIASDDNFSPLQRTMIMKFELLGA
jgi:hypothetical protein